MVLTTTAAAESVRESLRAHPVVGRPRLIAVDAIPASLASMFTEPTIGTDDIAYLQYTSGSTRSPAGVEVTHRAVCTNVLQMILAGDLHRNTHSVSWLPLYHDMGLIMIMFPALCGGEYLTLLDPMAFVRRPFRWIKELSAEAANGPTFAAAPNFAFELTAERGLPGGRHDRPAQCRRPPQRLRTGDDRSHREVHQGIRAPRPTRDRGEALLRDGRGDVGVASTPPHEGARWVYLDRVQLAAGHAVTVEPDAENAVAYVSCGHPFRDLWAVIASPEGSEVPDGTVGEIWLHGNNIARGYFGREEESQRTFANKLQSRLDVGSHAEDAPDNCCWLATGDLGVYIDGELYLTGRIKDLIIIDGRNHYPHDIETTVSNSSNAIRSGYVAAFSVPSDGQSGGPVEQLVVVAERAAGSGAPIPRRSRQPCGPPSPASIRFGWPTSGSLPRERSPHH